MPQVFSRCIVGQIAGRGKDHHNYFANTSGSYGEGKQLRFGEKPLLLLQDGAADAYIAKGDIGTRL